MFYTYSKPQDKKLEVLFLNFKEDKASGKEVSVPTEEKELINLLDWMIEKYKRYPYDPEQSCQ